MPFDPDVFLQSFQGKSVCFYPSCGENLRGLAEMPYELFVLSDYRPHRSLYRLGRVSNGVTMEALREPQYAAERRRFFASVSYSLGGVLLRASTIRTRVFQKDGKWFVLFFQDNNEAIARIKSAGLKVSCFIGKNDGCNEGGNYECVNEWPFLRKVLRIAADRMVYITDHFRRATKYGRGWLKSNSYLLARSPRLFDSFYQSRPADLNEVDKRSVYGLAGWVFVRKGVLFTRDDSRPTVPYMARRHFLLPDYSEETVEYLVLRHPQRIRGKSFKRVRLSFEFDDIGVAVAQSDGLIVSQHCFELMREDGLPQDKFYVVRNWSFETRNAKVFMERILRLANERRWRVVSTLPFGGGVHEGILQAACEWEGDLPEVVRIFHIDPSDFNDIEGELTEL